MSAATDASTGASSPPRSSPTRSSSSAGPGARTQSAAPKADRADGGNPKANRQSTAQKKRAKRRRKRSVTNPSAQNTKPGANRERPTRPDDRPKKSASLNPKSLFQVLDRSAEDAQERRLKLRKKLRFSPLTVQMIIIHLVGLALITGGVLYLSQTRENLIDAHQRLLAARARILAGTIADAILESENDAVLLHRRDLIPILRRPTSNDGTYARVYGIAGELVTDTNLIHDRIEQVELPPLHKEVSSPGLIRQVINKFSDYLLGSRYDLKGEDTANQAASNEEGIARALKGEEVYLIRRNEENKLVVSFFTPIQPVQHVVGALVLEVFDVDEAVRAERESIVKLFLVAAFISLGLLFLLGQTVVRPIKRLADAADVIRQGKTGRAQIPDFSRHNNEIGDLSLALRDMTNALYDRLEQNERFGADVAHEIKNPLTSLRSAVETFELAKSDEMREKLIGIIKHDVGRIDRLISDISRVSRLDAELARKKAKPVDLYALLWAITDLYNAAKKDTDPNLEVVYESETLAKDGRYTVPGFEDSLGQVLNNLIDNAKTFSPEGGVIRISVKRRYHNGQPIVILNVEDDGPGIPEENLESVFERFYTSRPDASSFGTHSGLGLNICRQIIDAHGGSIRAENRYEDEAAELGEPIPAPILQEPASATATGVLDATVIEDAPDDVLGARFVIVLPAELKSSKAQHK